MTFQVMIREPEVTSKILLNKLTRVRVTGKGRWQACCPAHEDKKPSLSVRELEDGRVLLHCFAGCSVSDIVSSVGLTLSDLFPEKIGTNAPRERAPFNTLDVLRCLLNEVGIVVATAATLAKGKALTTNDRERLTTAMERLVSSQNLIGK